MSVPTTNDTTKPGVTSSVSFNSTTSHMAGTTDDESRGVLMPVVIAILGLVVVVIVTMGCTYLYRSKRMARICDFWNRQRRRRLSSGSSQRALDDDGTSIDIPGNRREANLFSIDDEEPNQPNEDGYFYDEVFERSAFVDAKTNAALKELYLNTEDDLPDLSLREPRY